jgi:hypothetical protein
VPAVFSGRPVLIRSFCSHITARRAMTITSMVLMTSCSSVLRRRWDSHGAAPVLVDAQLMQGRYAELGGYTVSFETFLEDADGAPFFRGLPATDASARIEGS